MSKNVKKRIEELYNDGIQSKSEIARRLKSEFPELSFDAIRFKASRYIKRISNSDFHLECEKLGIDPETVKHYWYKGTHYSINVKGDLDNSLGIDFEKVISDCMSNYSPVSKIKHSEDYEMFDRLIWTDVHVGMDASRNSLALYPSEWNADVLFRRIHEMADFVLNNKTGSILIIDELGDFMDGWDGETTRKGHKLPQNMTNEEAFDTALKAKILLVSLLASSYDYIYCNNICEDNHAGSFGYIVNSAFKNVVDCKFNNVEVKNHQRFINHYIFGVHAFIITHGKDSRNLKFGFKPVLDPRTSEKISQYIRHNSELRSIDNIEFSKGDSHQCLFDMCTSDEFDYFNYPAFSPSSEWVQTNFKKGKSGFVMQNISKNTSQKITKTYFFN
jgi:hypothetical protein